MARGKDEPLPWYRRKDYKGKMPEAVKRELDAFRMQPEHPATRYDELPVDVQNYIGKLELEVYDLKQERAVATPLIITTFGLAWIYHSYAVGSDSMAFQVVALSVAIVVSWIFYRFEWRRNAEAFLPSDDPVRPTNEGIKREWEINHLLNRRDEN